MSRYLLDTGIVIRHLRGDRQTVQLVRGLGKIDRLSVASITRLEIFAGMHPDEKYATRKLLLRMIWGKKRRIGLERTSIKRVRSRLA